MTLTTDQLQQATDRLNERLAEFGVCDATFVFPPVSRGIMRLAWQVIEEMREEEMDRALPRMNQAYGNPVRMEVEMLPIVTRPAFSVDYDEYEAEPDDDPAPPKSDEKLTEPSPKTDADFARELDAYTAATLGPEHVMVTPLRPIGRDHEDLDKVRDFTHERAFAPTPDPVRLTNGQLRRAAVGEDVRRDFDDDEEDGDDDLDDDEPGAKHKRRWEMTPARRAYLDKAKHERWEASHTKGKRGNVLPTLDEVIAELKRQAMGGVMMPSIAQFDTAKPANWAGAGAQMQRLGKSWTDFAKEAGLQERRRGPQPQTA